MVVRGKVLSAYELDGKYALFFPFWFTSARQNPRAGISHSGAGPFLSSLSLGQKRIEFVNELIVLSTLCACFYPWGFRRLSQGIFAELRGQCESGGPAWSRSVPSERFRQLAQRWIGTQHSPPRSWRDGL